MQGASHSHPGQWNRELQQFLLKHTEIRMSACVCKPCECSMRRGLGGQFVGEFIPCWIKLEIKKQKQCCCVPGCGKTSERTCAFAPFHMICEAANVSLSEEEVTIPCSPFHMCSQHYYGTYSYCRSVSECALCGSKEKHRAGVERRQSVRPLQPESITLLLHEIGNFEKILSEESVVCNSCYQFCKRLLQQCGEDLRPAENIVHTLRAKVANLEERVSQCMNSSEPDESALLQAALFLGEEMLTDHAVMLYQKYASSLNRDMVLTSPRYKVLLFLGKEFGDLMSSSCPCKRIGRLLYRTRM